MKLMGQEGLRFVLSGIALIVFIFGVRTMMSSLGATFTGKRMKVIMSLTTACLYPIASIQLYTQRLHNVMDLRVYTDENGVVTTKDRHVGGVGDLKGFNPMTDRVLAYTNAKVASLNLQIADILEVSREYYHNDDLIANQINCLFKTELGVMEDMAETLYPNCVSKGKLMEPKKLKKQADKSSVDIAKFRTGKFLELYSEGLIMVDDKTYAIYYDIDHYATQQRLKAEIDKWQSFIYGTYEIPEDIKLKDWCADNKGEEGVKERGQAWSHYIAHSSLVFNLQRPWATTVHKAQGSEFETVYIAQADIKRSIRQGYYMNYARLMYVALSRAIHKVVIV